MESARTIIAYCKPESGPAALFHDALVQLLLHDRDSGNPRILDVLSLTSSPRIAATRNALIDAFFRHPREPEWLLMFDADMVFRPDVVERLLEVADPVERPIVSGLYFGGKLHGRQVPHAYVLNDTQDAFRPIEGIEGGWGKVARVHAVGAGCLLMHRAALAKIGHTFRPTGFPWFVEGAAKGRDYGEDMAFCLRALHLGIPIHCHTGVILGHVKPAILDEQTYAEYLAQRDMYGEDEVVRRYHERLRLPSAQHIPERWKRVGDGDADKHPDDRPPDPDDRPPQRTPAPFHLPPAEVVTP